MKRPGDDVTTFLLHTLLVLISWKVFGFWGLIGASLCWTAGFVVNFISLRRQNQERSARLNDIRRN